MKMENIRDDDGKAGPSDERPMLENARLVSQKGSAWRAHEGESMTSALITGEENNRTEQR